MVDLNQEFRKKLQSKGQAMPPSSKNDSDSPRAGRRRVASLAGTGQPGRGHLGRRPCQAEYA